MAHPRRQLKIVFWRTTSSQNVSKHVIGVLSRGSKMTYLSSEAKSIEGSQSRGGHYSSPKDIIAIPHHPRPHSHAHVTAAGHGGGGASGGGGSRLVTPWQLLSSRGKREGGWGQGVQFWLQRRLQVRIGAISQKDFHQLVKTVLGGNVDGGFPLGIAVVGDSALVDEEDGSGFMVLRGCTVEEGVPRAGIQRIHIGATFDQPGSKGVVKLTHLCIIGVGGV